MQLTKATLQEAVSRYCAQNRVAIAQGELTESMIQEGILSGISSMFGKGAALRNDYQVGDAASELRKLAQQRNQAEQEYDRRMDRFVARLAMIRQESENLSQVHQTIMNQFHASARSQYVRAATALRIPVAEDNAFYDQVDHELERRKLVPTLPPVTSAPPAPLHEGIPGAQQQVTPARTLTPTAPELPRHEAGSPK
jgi:hypothetical protein